MKDYQIKNLDANNFEIGAHTYSHTYLKGLESAIAEEEMLNGKIFLQDLLAKEISHFCFPGGRYDSKLVRISKKYFKSARTADTGALIYKPSFLIRPTFHFYERGTKSILFHSFKNNTSLFLAILKNKKNIDYFTLLESVLRELEKSPETYGIIIWGHSWEIDACQLWSRLEQLFIFINSYLKHCKTTYSDLINFNNHEKP